MKITALLISTCVMIFGCAHTDSNKAPQADERVLIRSTNGAKEVLICGPKLQRYEDRVVVRIRCEDKEVLTLQSHQTVYSDQASAIESVRIHWRDDGGAVVVNLLVNGGSQETRPYYIVWDGCAAAEANYEPLWPADHMGETNIYFAGWNNSGKPIMKVE